MKTLKIKNITAILFAFFIAATSFAQVVGGQQQQLFDLYVLGDYEKCYDKAIKMTEKDKTKYESEPYLYAAMCMVRIHEDPELREYYPDAVKDAIKLAAKFKKRDDRHIDKEEPHLFDDNQAIINELKQLAINEAKAYYYQDDYRKAAYYMRYGLRIDEDDPSLELFKGVSDVLSRNRRVGLEHIDNAIAKFEKRAKEGGFKANEFTYDAFQEGFAGYVKYLKENDELDKAREVIGLARKLDPDNGKFEKLDSTIE